MRLNWFVSIKYLLWSVTIASFISACSNSYPDIELNITECAPMPVSRAASISFVIDGNAPVDKAFEVLGIKQNNADDFDSSTVSGWVIETLGEIPQSGKEFEYDGYKISEIDGRYEDYDKVYFICCFSSYYRWYWASYK